MSLPPGIAELSPITPTQIDSGVLQKIDVGLAATGIRITRGEKIQVQIEEFPGIFERAFKREAEKPTELDIFVNNLLSSGTGGTRDFTGEIYPAELSRFGYTDRFAEIVGHLVVSEISFGIEQAAKEVAKDSISVNIDGQKRSLVEQKKNLQEGLKGLEEQQTGLEKVRQERSGDRRKIDDELAHEETRINSLITKIQERLLETSEDQTPEGEKRRNELIRAITEVNPVKRKSGLAALRGEREENPDYENGIQQALTDYDLGLADPPMSTKEVLSVLKKSIKKVTTGLSGNRLQEVTGILLKALKNDFDQHKLIAEIKLLKNNPPDAIYSKLLDNTMLGYILTQGHIDVIDETIFKKYGESGQTLSTVLMGIPGALAEEIPLQYAESNPQFTELKSNQQKLSEEIASFDQQIRQNKSEQQQYSVAIEQCDKRQMELEEVRDRESISLQSDLKDKALGNKDRFDWNSVVAHAAVRTLLDHFKDRSYVDFLPELIQPLVRQTVGSENQNISNLLTRLMQNLTAESEGIVFKGGRRYEFNRYLQGYANDLMKQLLKREVTLVTYNRESMSAVTWGKPEEAVRAVVGEFTRILGQNSSIDVQVYRPDAFFGMSQSEGRSFPASEMLMPVNLMITKRNNELIFRVTGDDRSSINEYVLNQDDGKIRNAKGGEMDVWDFFSKTRLIAGGLGASDFPERAEQMKKGLLAVKIATP